MEKKQNMLLNVILILFIVYYSYLAFGRLIGHITGAGVQLFDFAFRVLSHIMSFFAF